MKKRKVDKLFEEVIKEIKNMSSAKRLKLMEQSGIYTKTGRLTKQYKTFVNRSGDKNNFI